MTQFYAEIDSKIQVNDKKQYEVKTHQMMAQKLINFYWKSRRRPERESFFMTWM